MKTALKHLARLLALVLAIPFLVAYRIGALVQGPDAALENASQWLALWPGLTGSYVRVAFLSRVLSVCDQNTRICPGVMLSKAGAEIHQNVYIGPNSQLGLVTLEQGVLLGPAVQVPSGPLSHGVERVDLPIHDQAGKRARVRIGNGAWIGAGAIVMADVGAGTVVGAGSVVTKPLPENVVAAGVPARVIRQRDEPRTPDPSPSPTPPATEESKLPQHVG